MAFKKGNSINIGRKAIFERDGYACVFCQQGGGRLEADHIKPYSYFPDLRYVLSNGRTLCRPCHQATDTYLWKATRLYGRTEAPWPEQH